MSNIIVTTITFANNLIHKVQSRNVTLNNITPFDNFSFNQKFKNSNI